MNERMKVLELLQEGKITAEQAAELLSALDEQKGDDKDQRRDFPFHFSFPKKSTEELKSMTNQIKSSVTTYLDELKKNIDFDEWSFKQPPRVGASVEKELEPTVMYLTIDTKNGRVRASHWDEDHIRIQAKGYVRADNAEEARAALEASLSIAESQGRYELAVQPTKETGGVNIELYLPAGLKYVRVASHNGTIRAEGVACDEIDAEAHNGSIVLFQTNAVRSRLFTHNGGIDLQHSIQPGCRSVYARTHNGTIDIDGVANGVILSGTAKSHHGRVDVLGKSISAEYDDGSQKQHVRLRSASLEGAEEGASTQLFCETNNGTVVIRE